MNAKLLPSIFGDFKDFDKFFVGFDDHYNRIAKMHDEIAKSIPNYPPYNIKKTGDNTYVIELAVAGFGKQDIEIEMTNGSLIVRGNAASEQETPDSFLFKGIANRAFTRTFALDDQIEVKNAELLNGMLKVWLERIIPEHKKPKKIEVNETAASPAKSKKKQQLLQEGEVEL